jgi:hypothetical protein
MGRSPGFGSAPSDSVALFGLGFPAAPDQRSLTLPLRTTRRLIMQEARRHPVMDRSPTHRAPTVCRHTVSGSISLPSRGSFHLSLTVLVHYRSETVFSLRRWSSQIPTGFHVPRGTWVLDPESRIAFAYWALTVCGWPFQANSTSSPISDSPADSQLRPIQTHNPHVATAGTLCTTRVWALPVSFATTQGIAVAFLSPGY